MKLSHFTPYLPLVILTAFGFQASAVSEPPPPPIEPAAAFSQAELDQMLAPIALYPDALLSQVLMASTYPLEVVEASRWSRETSLSGEAAVDAAQDMNWDISIKALVAFPDLIQLMDQQLSWTRRLGDAFLLQEEQVMETIQMLRRRSLDEGNLDSLDHLVVEQREDVIIVEPREVEVVYVPYYNTRYVYGDWWWYDYPPVYWDYPYYRYNSFGFHWSVGFHISSRFYFSFCDWHHRHILLHHHRWYHGRHEKPRREHVRYDYHDRPGRPGYDDGPERSGRPDRPGGRDTVAKIPSREELEDIKVWNHNPHHRRGVEYRSETLNTTLQRTSASGIASVNMPGRSTQSARSVMKPPTLSRSSSVTESSPQRTLPTSNRRSLPSVASTRNTQPSVDAARSTQPERTTTAQAERYSLPGSSSRSNPAASATRPGSITSSRRYVSPGSSSSSRSAITTRPDTSSRSAITTRPDTSSRSSASISPGSSRSLSRPPAASSPPRQVVPGPSSSGRTYSSSPGSSSSSRSYTGSSSTGSSSSRSFSAPSRSSSPSGTGGSSRGDGGTRGPVPNIDR